MKIDICDLSKPIGDQITQRDMTDNEMSELQSQWDEETSEQLKTSALSALDKSDMVAMRCIKAGVPFPSEWQSYVSSLRSIVSTGNGTVPNQPAYPEGS